MTAVLVTQHAPAAGTGAQKEGEKKERRLGDPRDGARRSAWWPWKVGALARPGDSGVGVKHAACWGLASTRRFGTKTIQA